MNTLIEMLANDYPDSEHRMTVVDFADWLSRKAKGHRLVREARECRHCGWICAPNSAQTKSWYPLAPKSAPDHSEQPRQMVNAWAPVSERLPERDQYPILVANRSGAVRLVFGIIPFGDGDWMGYYEPSRQGRFLRGITHWMPMPDPPCYLR